MSIFDDIFSQIKNSIGQLGQSASKLTSSIKDVLAVSDVKFPEKLGTPGYEPIIHFQILDGVKASERKGTISLFLPSSLRVGYGANYTDFSDVLKMAGANLGAIGNIDSVGSFGSYLAGLGINVASLKLADIDSNVRLSGQRALGKAVNTFQSTVFESMALRQFQFEFKLQARNQGESDTIAAIIKKFKAAMHPSLENADSRFLTFPDCFQISFQPATLQAYLFNVGTCVLKDCQVNYTGSQMPIFFSSYAPVDIDLSLTFQEVQTVSREDIEGANSKNY